MAVATNTQVNLPARAVPGVHRTAGRRGTGARLVRGVHRGDGRRPGGLVSAPRRVSAPVCAPRPAITSLGWLILVAGLTFLIVLGLGWSGAADPAAAPVPQATTVVEVHPAETLWDIVHRMAPGSRATAVVDRIRQLNGLSDAALYPGELLRVPDGRASGTPAPAN